MLLVPFCTSWKHQKTSDFLMFSGGIERSMAWNGLNKSTFLYRQPKTISIYTLRNHQKTFNFLMFSGRQVSLNGLIWHKCGVLVFFCQWIRILPSSFESIPFWILHYQEFLFKKVNILSKLKYGKVSMKVDHCGFKAGIIHLVHTQNFLKNYYFWPPDRHVRVRISW